ncbi:MAG TPA: GntR family transcriptional regulator [Armatimonadota bacterium]|jgi:DNA-binding LacI/PurR family transcriptional regulator
MDQPSSPKQNKQQTIVGVLRGRIVAGELPPGHRLSSRAVRQEFGACAATTQAAIKTLVEDGFLLTEPRRGTYVSPAPPHLASYGVVFADRPLSVPPDGTLNSMLAYQCMMRQQNDQPQLKLYFGVNGYEDEEDYQRALADLEAHRLAGLFFVYGGILGDTPLVTHPGLARVTITKPFDHAPGIFGGHQMFFIKGLDHLATLGCRRVAILGCQRGPLGADDDFCREQVARRNMLMPPHWLIPDLPSSHEQMLLIRHYVYLLLRDRQDRPDSLVIADDAVLDSVLAGIFDAGVRIGVDLEVVAHCNYPLPKPDQWPVTRLGWPVPAVLDTAFDLLDRQRRGVQVPLAVTLPFVFTGEEAASVELERSTRSLGWPSA